MLSPKVWNETYFAPTPAPKLCNGCGRDVLKDSRYGLDEGQPFRFVKGVGQVCATCWLDDFESKELEAV